MLKYEQSFQLGKGNNEVYEVVDKKTGDKFALKVFNLNNEDIELFKNEIKLLEKIKLNPNKYIIKYLGYCIAEK